MMVYISVGIGLCLQLERIYLEFELGLNCFPCFSLLWSIVATDFLSAKREVYFSVFFFHLFPCPREHLLGTATYFQWGGVLHEGES